MLSSMELVKDENGDLPAYSHRNLNSCKNEFIEPLDVYEVIGVMEMRVRSSETAVNRPIPFLVLGLKCKFLL
jgi:hypothetical protein